MLKNLGRRTINLAAALRTDCRGGRRSGGLWKRIPIVNSITYNGMNY